MKRFQTRAIVVGAASLTVVLGCVNPAGAVVKDAGAQSGYGGQGYVQADINFTAARTYQWNGFARDICPADNVGVSFKFQHTTAGGAASETGVLVADTGGCDNGDAYGSGTVTRQNRIAQTRIRLCFTNNGDQCWLESLYSSYANNPYA